jgi:hypothetical protein
MNNNIKDGDFGFVEDSWQIWQSLIYFFRQQHQEHLKSQIIYLKERNIMSEIANNLKLAALTDEVEARERTEKGKFHRHIDGREGASALGHCCLLRACRKAKVQFPEVKGLKSEKGAFDTGDIFHHDTQTKAKQIIKEKNFGFACSDEVMIETPITKQTTVESPVDLALSMKPAVPQKWKFADGEYEVNVLPPGGTWLRIWDIKSASDYGFWKAKNEGAKFGWKAQFHAYMKATNLPELTVFVVHKEKLYKHEIRVPWEDKVWERVVSKQLRVESLTDQIKAQVPSGSFEVEVTKDDLEYFDSEIEQDADDICWWSCPFSTTHETQDATGKTHLVLDKPCPWACQFLRQDAENNFAQGQHWWRGRSYITIESINWDDETITSHNKKYETKPYEGGLFVDSIYVALKQFKAQKEEE